MFFSYRVNDAFFMCDIGKRVKTSPKAENYDYPQTRNLC